MWDRRATLLLSLLVSPLVADVSHGQDASGQESYPGVVPGTSHAPAVLPPAGSSPMSITWPGFQMLPNGGSRVFVQANGVLGSAMTRKGNTLTIKLGHARLAHKNNGRPLDTHYFKTPVQRVDVQIKKGEALLVIDLKHDAAPTVTTAPGADGFQFLYVDFAPGS